MIPSLMRAECFLACVVVLSGAVKPSLFLEETFYLNTETPF